MKYTPTLHAIERARLRFGIPSESVTEWINAIMADAKYIAANGKNRLIYESEPGDVQIVVDGNTHAVITIHHAVRTDFLRPALDREIRKLKREGTRKVRATERRLAEAYAQLAELSMNYAKARNPNTRELIDGRIRDKEAQINDLKRSIKRQQDDMQAKIKAVELIKE